ncbi:uncharacterized protein LOC111268587 [Varroa jacobsoni]|uniref:G-protein coupled receptors family 2 profile 2 domain-containing protein n=1 Tax=Varroa destructor TaxID=109461 RepID=A0A7M7KT82_VARDE|nr:uncharacterized protein LOC111254751 [Varroa destructor]XP_022703396.1 uncharacterized protein LOC111268587 [Varroa jacobsoni]
MRTNASLSHYLMMLMSLLLILVIYRTFAAFDQLQHDIKEAVQRDFSKLYRQQYLCLRDNIRAPTPVSLRTALCFCDSQCSRYGDCCVDVDIRDKKEERQGYHCSQLGLRFFYTKMGCGEDDGDDPTFAKYRCEENPEHMENVSHLIDQPQFHLKSRTLYKNIYCVLCNMPFSNIKEARGDIYHWKQRYMWFSEEMTPDTWSVVRLTNKWKYDPKVRQYIVAANGSDYKFTVDAEEYDWGNFSAHFNTRLCPEVPVIEDCPLRDENLEVDPDVEEWEKYCPLYTAYVHSDTLDAYQNAHCALCRGVPLNRLNPGLPSLPEERTTPVGKKGDMFNSYRNKLICKPGEVAVLNSFCSPVLCQPGWIWNGAHCVSQEGEVGCFYLTLEAEWVKFMMNGSVMLLDSKQIFNQYSNITSKSGVPTHVRVCLKTAITVSLNPAQELVAEVCLMSSSVCLLLQLIVYLLIPTLRVTRPGKIVMSLSLTILLGHVMFLIKDDIQPGTYMCFSIGLMAHYFYLASFFWMLVMALDSCRCLAVNVFNATGGPYLMIKYSILGIFCPALIVCSSVIYDGFSPYSRYAPRYGREVCWIGSRYGLMAFFVAPIVTILLFNFMLFVYTAYTVRQVQTRSEKFRTNPSGYQTEMTRLKLYIRLVVVLGFTWFFGVLSALTDISWLWYPFFVLGGAQGVFIFVAFTCKRKVWNELKPLFWRGSVRRRSTRVKQRTSTDITSNNFHGFSIKSAPPNTESAHPR